MFREQRPWPMHKLPEVEDAKALMEDAIDWSVFTWLWEKKKVRQAADVANHVLDQLNRKIKASWSDETKAAYRELVEESRRKGKKQNQAKARPEISSQASERADSDLISLLKKVKDADDEAHDARMDAEATFDEADRQMNLSLAREGCGKAILSWELHEKAIRKAEAVAKLSKS